VYKLKLQFRVKLRQVLERKGVTQKELAKKTGLREATISELINDLRSGYTKSHILKIMEALNLTDLSEILEVISIDD
jgi:putative transcriptional regulator